MSPKEILDLGQALSRDLDRSLRDQVLARWLAHYLAETLAEAASAKGEARAEPEAKAMDLILRLWAERRNLPEDVDPLGEYRNAITALARLEPDANPWASFTGNSPEALLGKLYQSLGRVFLAGLLANSASGDVRDLDGAMAAAMTDEERRLRELLDGWKSVLQKRERTPPIIRFVRAGDTPGSADGGTAMETGDAETRPPEDPLIETLETSIEQARTLLIRLKAARAQSDD